ncbi:hypothetical protein AB1484_06000 [Parafrankia sp. FMc6]|uniref:hypothetical protein n=1 Tax=Parafrankia soli TaxID=2599596 RepID=UPI0034D76A95
MTKTEAARIAREARRAAAYEAALDRAVAGFYASGGWTEERRARFVPIWAETCRLKALREQEPAEPLAVQADAA